MPVYDDQDTRTLREAEESAPVGHGPDGRATPKTAAAATDELADINKAVDGAKGGGGGGLFRDDSDGDDSGGSSGGDSGTAGKKKGFLSKRGRRVGMALVFGTGITGIALAIFMPILRLDSILSKINEKVFTYASSAVAKRTEHLFGDYLLSHVINLDKCGNRADINCRATYANKGRVRNLYAGWRDAKIEEKFFDDYGIQVESLKNPDRPGGEHLLTLRDRRGQLIKISEKGIQSGQFTGGPREFGRDVNAFLRKNTRWYQFMERNSLRKYLTRKHGARFWCFWSKVCKLKDNLGIKFKDMKTKYKYKFVEKFVYPFSPKYGFIIECIVSGGSRCKKSTLERRLAENVIKRAEAISEKEAVKIIEDFTKNPNRQLSTYILERLLFRIFQKESSRVAIKSALSAIPIAGQIYFALTIIDGLDRIDSFIKDDGLTKLDNDLKGSQYVEYYSTMRSANDEIKQGESSLDEAGAVMDSFDGHEKSKLYDAMNYKESTVASSSSLVYAATGTDPEDDYRCNNGKPIPADDLVCPEKKVGRTFLVQDLRHSLLGKGADLVNSYGRCNGKTVRGHCVGIRVRTVVRPVLHAIDSLSDRIFGTVSKGIIAGFKHAPYVGTFVKKTEKIASDATMAVTQKAFPLPINIDSPGRDNGDALVAGGEMAAKEFGQGGYDSSGGSYGVGGEVLSSGEQAAIARDYNEQNDYNMRHSSLWARLTSTDNPKSLVSQLAAHWPTSPRTGGAQLIINGLNNLGNAFTGLVGSLFTQHAMAATSLYDTKNAFNIPRVGVPLNDPTLTIAPEKLTESFCNAAKKTWEASFKTDRVSKMEVPTTTNPCLLDDVVDESVGGGYKRGSDDSNNPGSSGECAAGTDDLGEGEGWSKGNKQTIHLCGLPNLPSRGEESTKSDDDYIEGANGHAIVNAEVSGGFFRMVEAAKAAGLNMSAQSSYRTMAHQRRLCNAACQAGNNTAVAKPGFSNHQMGYAIDFTMPTRSNTIGACTRNNGRCEAPGDPVWTWLSQNAANFELKQYVNEFWHFSKDGH